MAESCEYPLKLRREWLAKKFLIKKKSISSPIIDSAFSLFLLTLTHKYWIFEKDPPFVGAFNDLKQSTTLLHISPKLICYTVDC